MLTLAQGTIERLLPRAAIPWRALYAHVPFCRHKCHYCDFYSFVDHDDRQEAFVRRIEEEAEAWRARRGECGDGAVESIFVGGGTPTMLRPDLLRRLCQALVRAGDFRGGGEFTVEANPDTVTKEVAGTLAGAGVNRVSMGCQSFEPLLLEQLERTHDPARVPEAVATLREAGIPQVNVDLIFAIPTETEAQWQSDLERAIALKPDHISCYGLVYEPNTPLTMKLNAGKVGRVDEEVEARMYEAARARLAQEGFDQYEISNWARPGCRCRHNLAYWQNADWMALGPSASGHAQGLRWKNAPHLSRWLASGPWSPAVDVEMPDEERAAGEAFMLGLRLMEGMESGRVEALLHVPGGERRRREIAEALHAGVLVEEAGRIRFAAGSLLTSDSLLSRLV